MFGPTIIWREAQLPRRRCSETSVSPGQRANSIASSYPRPASFSYLRGRGQRSGPAWSLDCRPPYAERPSGTFERLRHLRTMTMPRSNPHPTSASVAPVLSDHELVERVRAGDAVTFELIMRRHNRRLFRLARSILRSGAEAEDVVQETYVRAYARLDQFVGPHGLAAWLARIAANEALGRIRGWGRVVSLDEYLGEEDADVRRIETMTSRTSRSRAPDRAQRAASPARGRDRRAAR